MDLTVHRTMLWLGLTRHCPKMAKEAFLSTWMGNWLTDMNQATAFFALGDSQYDAYDAIRPDGTFKLPSAFGNEELKHIWLNLYQALWVEEVNCVGRIETLSDSIHSSLEPAVTGLHEIGAYFPYDHFGNPSVVLPTNWRASWPRK